jgi:hypothetical protein
MLLVRKASLTRRELFASRRAPPVQPLPVTSRKRMRLSDSYQRPASNRSWMVYIFIDRRKLKDSAIQLHDHGSPPGMEPAGFHCRHFSEKVGSVQWLESAFY